MPSCPTRTAPCPGDSVPGSNGRLCQGSTAWSAELSIAIEPVIVLLVPVADDSPCLRSDDGKRRNIARNHGAHANDRTVTDRRSRRDADVHADPNIAPDRYR